MAVYQGIDAGSTKLRKVTINGGWGRVSPSPKARPKQKIIAVPANLLTYRSFTFPFSDKRRIREILPGELTDSLILPLDQVYWNISSISKNRASAIITPKETLDKFIQSMGNSIDVIDTEPGALARLAEYNKLKNVLIIDFGANKTAFYSIHKGYMDFVRVRLKGGNSLDELLAQKLNVSTEKAEEIKAEKGTGSPAVKKFLSSLITDDVKSAAIGCDSIVITGGGSQMPGLSDFLTETLELPVEYFDMPDNLSPSFDAVAFGASLYEVTGKDKVNLKDRKEKSGGSTYRWLYLLIIPFILYAVNLKLLESQLTREKKDLRNLIRSTAKKQFPEVKRWVSPIKQIGKIIKQASAGESGAGMKTLDIFTGISKARAGVTVTFYEIEIIDAVVKLRGETDSFESVEKLKNALAKNFSEVEIKDQKTKSDDTIDFTIKLETIKVDTDKPKTK